MNNEQIEELKKLAEAATPGPWVWHDNMDSPGERMAQMKTADGEVIFDFGDATKYYPTEGTEPDFEDVAFMVAANPAAVLELIADRKELVERNAYMADEWNRRGVSLATPAASPATAAPSPIIAAYGSPSGAVYATKDQPVAAPATAAGTIDGDADMLRDAELLASFPPLPAPFCPTMGTEGWFTGEQMRGYLMADRAKRQAQAPVSGEPTATHGPLHLTNRKTADLASRGYNIVGYVLRREDGEEVCLSAESAVRWLPQAHYWRLMHEQDGSLFAAAAPVSAAPTTGDELTTWAAFNNPPKSEWEEGYEDARDHVRAVLPRHRVSILNAAAEAVQAKFTWSEARAPISEVVAAIRATLPPSAGAPVSEAEQAPVKTNAHGLAAVGVGEVLAQVVTSADASVARPADGQGLLPALKKAAKLLRAAGFAMTGTATSEIVAAINAAKSCDKAPSGWQCTRAASHDGPCAAVRAAGQELPALPEPTDQLAQADGFNVIGTSDVYTADQMQEYARAALAMRQPQGVTLTKKFAADVLGALFWRDKINPDGYERIKQEFAAIMRGESIADIAAKQAGKEAR